MSETTNGIANNEDLAEFGKLVLEATKAWQGGIESLRAVTTNQQALNRVAHLIACEEHGITEISYPFYLSGSHLNIRKSIRDAGIETIGEIFFEELHERWWYYKWKHPPVSTMCAHFVLIRFANKKGLDYEGQKEVLINLGYSPAQFHLIAPFAKRCNGGLSDHTMFPGHKEYAFYGTSLMDSEAKICVLSQTVEQDSWKKGPWRLSLKKVDSSTRDHVMVVTASNPYDLPMRLPGPLQYTRG